MNSPRTLIFQRKFRPWFFLLALLIIALLLSVLYSTIMRFPNTSYRDIHIPAIKTEVQSMANVTIQEIKDNGPDDEANFYVTLLVANKGEFILLRPTRESFTGGGNIYIHKIGNCVAARSTALIYKKWQINTVADIVDHYDEIYAWLIAEKLCG